MDLVQFMKFRWLCKDWKQLQCQNSALEARLCLSREITSAGNLIVIT